MVTAADIKTKTADQLSEQLVELKKEQFNLRFQRASGQLEKSRATANEGLALLPALPPGSVKPNIRKLLDNEIKTRF